MIRRIIKIDEDACYGCGLCAAACHEGAIGIVDGKAKLMREDYRTAIHAINTSGAFVVSVDINSGMNGDTGNCEIAVRSDLTVTIGYVKTGLVTENAGHYMKRLVCADIGITLVKEEGTITAATCPPWLDMEPIHAVL